MGIVREAKIVNMVKAQETLFIDADLLNQSSSNHNSEKQFIHKQPCIYMWSISLFLGLLIAFSQGVFAQTIVTKVGTAANLGLHTVSANETLYAIAQRYETSVEKIVDTNQLSGKTIYVGQRLYVPEASNHAILKAQAPQKTESEQAVTVASQGFYITIAPGESLLAIALQYGVAIGELARINNITDVTEISAGSPLYIPVAQTQVTPVAEQLQTVAEGSGTSGTQNIQIVATRGRSAIVAPNTNVAPTAVTVYPNGPQVSIGIGETPASQAASNVSTSAEKTVIQSVGVSQRLQPVQPVEPVQTSETVGQPVGGFVPENESPKQQLLQQQMILLRQSGPQLSIFQPPLQEFAWPLEINGRISSNYGNRRLAITANRFHYGLDVAALTGTAVKASKSGTVKEASWIGGYGNAVYIDHPDGTQTRYAHMSKLNVEVGDDVAQGDVIGKVGSTGVSTGPHLHFEIRVKGYAVDPLEYVSQP